MRRILFTIIGCLFIFNLAQAQIAAKDQNTKEIVLDNEHMIVTQYVSTPGHDVCGPDKHSHPAHLSILLTGAEVQLTAEDGETQRIEMPAGTTFWSEEETHLVKNSSQEIIKVLLVELKD